MVLVSADRAKDLREKPAYVMGAMGGSHYRAGAAVHNTPDYATSTFKSITPRLYEMAGIGPKDVDVLQSYENFTGVLMSIVEHGFCQPEDCNEFSPMTDLGPPMEDCPSILAEVIWRSVICMVWV